MPGDLPRLADMQARMLRNALGALADNGRLVYSTCSLEPEENEKVLGEVLSEEPRFRTLTSQEFALDYPALIPFVKPDGWFRTRPDEHGTDGFNAVVVVRKT
ncbi:MAG: hypothetical protein ABSE93_07700 [Terriglobia bacterium]|jgi:16S rRNA (cytosine967-C5)-methyltransferase